MWLATFELDGSKATLGSAAKKANIRVLAYPISFHQQQDRVQVYFAAFLFGEDKNKKTFIQLLQKNLNILNIENNNSLVISQISDPGAASVVYNPKIIFAQPVEIRADGTESWTLGSWEKEPLMNAGNFMKEHYSGCLMKINETPITSFSFLNINPKLSTNQLKAVSLAIHHGYYEIPRKITLENLAEIMGISFSTCHNHLRKAEKKLMPFLFEKCL